MSYQFDWVKDYKNSCQTGQAFLSINNTNGNNRFYLSSIAMELLEYNFKEDDITYIKVGLDKEKKMLAIKPYLGDDINGKTYKLSKGGSKSNSKCFTSNTLYETIEPFLNTEDDGNRYKAKFNTKYECLVVDLKEKN